MHIKASLHISLVLGIIHVTSCSSTSENGFAKFPEEVNMGSVRVEEIRIDNCFSPIEIFVYDSIIILNDTRDANMFLKMFSQSGDFINGFGAIGNGPNEYINPSLFKVYPQYDALWLMEPPKRLIHRIPLNQMVSSVENGFTPTATIQLQGQMMINDYYQISDSTLLVYNPTSDNLFSEMDISGNIVKTYGSNNNRKVSDNHIANFIYNRGVLTVHNNKAFLFYNLLNKITRFDFETMDRTDRLGDNYIDIIPDIHESGNLTTNYSSFVSNVSAYNNLLFVVYNGDQIYNEEQMRANYSNTILAFSENIEPIAKLNFPFGILTLTISKEGMLYIVPDNFEGVIFKYDLTNVPSLLAQKTKL